MADEVFAYGIPGVGPNGEIVPFIPNPPWIHIPHSVVGNPSIMPGWDEVTSLDYYKDMFGNVHVRGIVTPNSGAGTGPNNALVIELPNNCLPTTDRYFITQAYRTGWPSAGVDVNYLLRWYVSSNGGSNGYTKVVLQIGPSSIPNGIRVITELSWETT